MTFSSSCGKTIRSILCAGILMHGTLRSQQPMVTDPPNIIHILADDVGYDDLQCYGAKDIPTPNLDRMASEGVRFTSFYAPHGTGSASRGAILTGRVSSRLNGGLGMPQVTPFDTAGLDPKLEMSIAYLLKDRGYVTGMIGNWDLGQSPGHLPENHGFDHFLGIPYAHEFSPERSWGTGSLNYPPVTLIRDTTTHATYNYHEMNALPSLFRQEACRFIREKAHGEQPFYLLYAPVETHAPWLIPAGFEGSAEAGPYGDAVSYLDQTIGAILRTLRELGIDQNTLMVFSSACGPRTDPDPELESCFGNHARINTGRVHQLRGGKFQSRYEGGTRVPCIMRWPGYIPANGTVGMITAGYDLFSTFAAVARVTPPPGRIIDGKDLMPVLTGANQDPLHLLFFGFEPEGMLMSIRYKNWKLVVPSGGTIGAAVQTEFELYQLNTDAGEQNNVAERFPEIVDQLRQFGEKARKAIRDNTRLPERNFIE